MNVRVPLDGKPADFPFRIAADSSAHDLSQKLRSETNAKKKLVFVDRAFDQALLDCEPGMKRLVVNAHRAAHDDEGRLRSHSWSACPGFRAHESRGGAQLCHDATDPLRLARLVEQEIPVVSMASQPSVLLLLRKMASADRAVQGMKRMMCAKRRIDYSLYLVSDRGLSLGRSTLDIVRSAVEGGVTIVQLREKEATTREFYEEGLKIRDYLRKKSVPLIINDRVDVALALDADGVHVGESDLPVTTVREILGPDKIIGASALTIAEAQAAERDGADYLGLSPIFRTATKPALVEEIGLEGIPPLRQAVRIPIVGIGSMNEKNAFAAIKAGLNGVAVVSAICSHSDPRAAAAAIRAEVERAKRKEP
jgi:thiamine-phosphate pyrophosphorylase